jgi:anti-sigma factor RsiW
MLNNGNKINCEFKDDIVSYLYDETGASERTKFENHLAHCSVCTDEFAAISNARFSVFEWQREEFADLATPEIVIPYPAKRTDEGSVTTGIWAPVRAWLSLGSFPVAIAVGLVLCLGLGLTAFQFLGSPENPIASNVKSVPPIETVTMQDSVATTNSKRPEVAVDTQPPTHAPPSREILPVRVVEGRKTISKKQLNARNPIDRKPAQNIPAAPILSENYEESQDASLRLADLFADVDG